MLSKQYFVLLFLFRIINKQNKYPVLLLTAGKNDKYDYFMDPRTWTIRNGVLFAEMSGLLGLSAMAEAVMRDPSQLEMVRKYGQIIFTWTDEKNDKVNIFKKILLLKFKHSN